MPAAGEHVELIRDARAGRVDQVDERDAQAAGGFLDAQDLLHRALAPRATVSPILSALGTRTSCPHHFLQHGRSPAGQRPAFPGRPDTVDHATRSPFMWDLPESSIKPTGSSVMSHTGHRPDHAALQS